MNMKIAFYDTKPYDKIWFAPLAKEMGIEIQFLETKLNKDTVRLSKAVMLYAFLSMTARTKKS